LEFPAGTLNTSTPGRQTHRVALAPRHFVRILAEPREWRAPSQAPTGFGSLSGDVRALSRRPHWSPSRSCDTSVRSCINCSVTPIGVPDPDTVPLSTGQTPQLHAWFQAMRPPSRHPVDQDVHRPAPTREGRARRPGNYATYRCPHTELADSIPPNGRAVGSDDGTWALSPLRSARSWLMRGRPSSPFRGTRRLRLRAR
jgi:hypothetical protein